MSLFRPEYLCVGLEPARTTVLRLAGSRKPQVRAELEIPIPLDPSSSQLRPLFEALTSEKFNARDVHITLADSLVRYFVVERPENLRNQAELRGAISSRFEEQFGADPAAWEIATDLAPGADAYLACAVPRLLVDSLRQAFADLRLNLKSLSPYAVSEMNRWHRKLPAKNFWFAAAEADNLTLGYKSKNGWRGIRRHSLFSQSEGEIAMLAERDGLLHGVSDSAPIRCVGLIAQPVASIQGTSVSRPGAGLWPGANEAWSRKYRLTLSGVWP